jgi:DNA-binding ferritin-like protein
MENVGLFLGTLMQSRNQAHIYHLQVTGPGSHAAHLALQAYYEGIVPLVDAVAEGIQGRYGIVKGYQMAGAIKEDNGFVSYFESLCKFVETARKAIPQDSYVQNQVDTIVDLIETTKYKLRNLQ